MKKLLIAFLFLISQSGYTQSFFVQDGLKFQTTGDLKTNLYDLDVENDGFLNDKEGSITLHSNSKKTEIKGSGFTSFNNLKVDTEKEVFLHSSIEVRNNLEMVNGNFNLREHNLILPFNESKIINERSDSRIWSSGKGELVKTTTIKKLRNENIGNLGLVFNDFANEGTLEIRRGHQEVSIPFGTSITRYYKVRTQKWADEKIELDLKYYKDEILVNDPNLDETIWVNNSGKWNNTKTSTRYLFGEDQFVAEAKLELYESIITVGFYKKLIDQNVIPTAFTPNGDSVNDRFILPGIEKLPNAEVSIYSKSGTIIYRTENYQQNPWDGTYKGQSLPTSTYLYVINDSKNRFETIEGEISIVK